MYIFTCRGTLWHCCLGTFLKSSSLIEGVRWEKVKDSLTCTPVLAHCCRPGEERWHSSVSQPVWECPSTPGSPPAWEPDCKTSAPPLWPPTTTQQVSALRSRQIFLFLIQTSLWTKGGDKFFPLKFKCNFAIFLPKHSTDWFTHLSALFLLHLARNTHTVLLLDLHGIKL